MRKFMNAVKMSALRANALEIPDEIRKEWMATQVQLELCTQGKKQRSL